VKPKETKAKSAWDTTPTHSAASSTPSTSLLVKAATAITSAGRMSSQKRKKLLANDNKEVKICVRSWGPRDRFGRDGIFWDAFWWDYRDGEGRLRRVIAKNSFSKFFDKRKKYSKR
jgi:hypothetical protein